MVWEGWNKGERGKIKIIFFKMQKGLGQGFVKGDTLFI